MQDQSDKSVKTCTVHVIHSYHTWWTVLGNLSGFEKNSGVSKYWCTFFDVQV